MKINLIFIYVFRLIIREVDGHDIGEYVATARGKTSKAQLTVEGTPSFKTNSI
jgi:hypothetical protein